MLAPTGGDTIEVRGLRLMGVHGVLPEERTRSQPFEVDLDLRVDLATAGDSDDLEDTVDYAAVVDRVAGVVAGRTHHLLESLAEAVVTAVLDLDDRIREVTVSVRKLRPPLPADVDTVGVRVARQR